MVQYCCVDTVLAFNQQINDIICSSSSAGSKQLGNKQTTLNIIPVVMVDTDA